MPVLSDRPVVVGVDGTPGGEGALRYAVAEACRRGVALRLVHVLADGLNVVPAVAPIAFRDAGQEVLDSALAAARELGPDLDVDGALLIGRRANALVDASRDAALLVLGRETRSRIDRLLTGTTTAATAAHASCDVAVVPSFWTQGDEPRRVVVGVRSVTDARAGLARAMSEAAWRGCPLTAVMAWHIPDVYLDRIEARTHAEEWTANGKADLEYLVAPLRATYPDVDVDLEVVHGRPASVLLSAAESSALLVLTRRHFSIPPHERLGGVGHSVLRLSDVPVLVVPSGHERMVTPELRLEAAGAPLK
jgi:nucleotide-binding universal stress UspA family protein